MKSPADILAAKAEGRKLTALTAYDYPIGRDDDRGTVLARLAGSGGAERCEPHLAAAGLSRR